jgi:HSP20 family protein
MALIPWKPFSDLERFFEDDWFLPIMSKWEVTGGPAMDVYETEKEVVAEVNIPDFDPEKIEVSVKNGFLTVSGKTEENREENKKGYWRKEIKRGSFERVVKLPVAVKEDQVDAVYKKGILKIVMPKAENEPTSKVRIRVED